MKNYKHYIRIIGWISVLLIIAPFLFLSLYNVPSSDDFCRWHIGGWQDYLQFFQTWILDHNGRYFNALMVALPLWYKDWMYLLVFPLFSAFFVIAIRRLLHKSIPILSKTDTLLTSMVMLCFLIVRVPDIASSFYWFASVTVYWFSFSTYIFLLSYILEATNKEQLSLMNKGLCILLVFATIGSNEVTMLITDVTLCLWLVYLWQKKSSLLRFGTLLLLCGVAFSLLLYWLPGTHVRQDGLVTSMNIQDSILHSIPRSVNYILHCFEGGEVLFASLAAVLIFAGLDAGKRKNVLPVLMSIAVLFVVMFLIHFTYYFCCGFGENFMSGRMFNQIFYFFSLFAGILCFHLGSNLLSTYVQKESKWYPWVTLAVVFIFSIKFVSESNVKRAYVDIISGNHKIYQFQHQARVDFFLETGLSNTSLGVPEIQFAPQALFVTDLEEETSHWKNQCFSTRFDKNISVYTYPAHFSKAKLEELLRKDRYLKDHVRIEYPTTLEPTINETEIE